MNLIWHLTKKFKYMGKKSQTWAKVPGTQATEHNINVPGIITEQRKNNYLKNMQGGDLKNTPQTKPNRAVNVDTADDQDRRKLI